MHSCLGSAVKTHEKLKTRQDSRNQRGIPETMSSQKKSTTSATNETRSKKFSLKNKKNLGMACHTPPLKKAKKQGEMPLPSLGPIPLQKCRI